MIPTTRISFEILKKFLFFLLISIYYLFSVILNVIEGLKKDPLVFLSADYIQSNIKIIIKNNKFDDYTIQETRKLM